MNLRCYRKFVQQFMLDGKSADCGNQAGGGQTAVLQNGRHQYYVQEAVIEQVIFTPVELIK